MATAPAVRTALDRDAWIDAATDALAEQGLSGIRVETLAKVLNVTKGSFYWHFANRDALQQAVLERWRDGRIKDIVKQTECRPGAERAQIEHVLSVYSLSRSRRGMRIELAVRDWASRDARVATIVRAVDATRFARARDLFLRCNMPPEEAASRSILLYAYVFGQSLLDCEKFDVDIQQARTSIFALIKG